MSPVLVTVAPPPHRIEIFVCTRMPIWFFPMASPESATRPDAESSVTRNSWKYSSSRAS